MRSWTWRALSFHSQWKIDVIVILYAHQPKKSNEFQDSKKKNDLLLLSFFQSKSFHYNVNNSIHLSTDNFIWGPFFLPGSTRSNEESCSSKERSRKKEKDGGTGISEARKNTILPKEMWVLIQSCTLSNFWNCEGFLMFYWHCSQCVVLYNASAIPFISLFTE